MDEISEEGEADGMEKSKESKDTYVPSGRLDSGITRSRVWGSTAIPAVVFGGLRGGRDIVSWEDQVADFKSQSLTGHGFCHSPNLPT